MFKHFGANRIIFHNKHIHCLSPCVDEKGLLPRAEKSSFPQTLRDQVASATTCLIEIGVSAEEQ
jgi:hypothetical protein